jgi:hypothetical protein
MHHQKSVTSLASTIDEQLKSSYSPKEVRFSSNLILSDSNEGSTDQSSEDSQIMQQHEQPRQLQPIQQVVVIEATPTTSPTLLTPASTSLDDTHVDEATAGSNSVPNSTGELVSSSLATFQPSSNIDDDYNINNESDAYSSQVVTDNSEELCQLQTLIMNANYKNTFTQINDNDNDSTGSSSGSRHHHFRHDVQSSMDENEEESTNSETTLEMITEELPVQQQQEPEQREPHQYDVTITPTVQIILNPAESIHNSSYEEREEEDELTSAANELTLIAQQHSAEVVQSVVAIAIIETSISNAVDQFETEEAAAVAEDDETTEEEKNKKKRVQGSCKDDEIEFKERKDSDDDDDQDKGPNPDSDQARISLISSETLVSESSHSQPSGYKQHEEGQHDNQNTLVEDLTENSENIQVESEIDLPIRSAPFDNEHLFDSDSDPKPLLTSSFMSFDGSNKLPGEDNEEIEHHDLYNAKIIISSSSDITSFEAVNNNGVLMSKEEIDEEEEDKMSNKTLEDNINNVTTSSSSNTHTASTAGKIAAEDNNALENDDNSSTCSFFTATSSIHPQSIHSAKQNHQTNNLIKQESVQTNQTGVTTESGSYHVTANEYNSSSPPFSSNYSASNLPKSASSQLRFEQNTSTQAPTAAFFASSAMTTSDSFHTALDLLSSKASSVSNSGRNNNSNNEPGYAQSMNSSYSGYSSDTFASLNTSFASSNQTLSATDNEDNEDTDNENNTTMAEDENEATFDDGDTDRRSVSTVTSFASNVNQNSAKSRLAMSESDANLGQFNVEYFLKNMHSLVSDTSALETIMTTTTIEPDSPASNNTHQDTLVITENNNTITTNIDLSELNNNNASADHNSRSKSSSKTEIASEVDAQSSSGTTYSTLTNNTDAVEDFIENIVNNSVDIVVEESHVASQVVENIIDTDATNNSTQSSSNIESVVIPQAIQIGSGGSSSNDSRNGSDNVSCTSSVLEFERLEAQCDLDEEVMSGSNNLDLTAASASSAAGRRLTSDIYENIEEEDENAILDFDDENNFRSLKKQSSLEEFVLATQHRDLNTIYESFEKEAAATSSSEAGLNDSTTMLNNNNSASNLNNKEENEYVIVDDLKKASENVISEEFVIVESTENIPVNQKEEETASPSVTLEQAETSLAVSSASAVEVLESANVKSIDNSGIVNHVTIEPASPIPLPLRSSQTIDVDEPSTSTANSFSDMINDKRRDSEPVNKPLKSDLSLASRLNAHSIQSSPLSSSPNTPSSTSKPKSLSIAHTPSSSSDNNSSPLQSLLAKNSLLFAQHSLSSSNASLKSTDSFENELKPKVKLDETSFFARRQLEKQNRSSSSQQSGGSSSRNSIASQKDENIASSSTATITVSKIPVLISSRKSSAGVVSAASTSTAIDQQQQQQAQMGQEQNDMEASQITLKSSMISDSGQSSMTASLMSTSQLTSPLTDQSSTATNTNSYISNSSSNNGSILVSLDSAYSFLSSSQSGSMLAATSSYMSDLAANASGSTSSSYITQQQQHMEMRESLSSNSLSGGGTRTKKTSRRQSRTSSSASSSSSTSLNNDSKFHQQTIHHVLSGLNTNPTGNQKSVFTAEDLPSFRKMATSPAPGSSTSNSNSGSSKPTSNTASPIADAIPNIGNLNSGSISKINSNLPSSGSGGGHTHGHTSNCYCLGGGGSKKSGQDESYENK